MSTFLAALRGGLIFAARLVPALPLYLTGLLIGLIQTWPALFAARSDLPGSLLRRLARGDGDGLVALFVSGDPSDAGNTILVLALWLLATLGLIGLYALAYNLFSGGILSVWAGVRPFLAGCRHSFWSFTGLGALLLICAGLALALAGLAGSFLGVGVGIFIGLVLLQLAGLLGEYARAIIVTGDRRNPALALVRAVGFCARRPGTLALALAGIVLQSGLAWLSGRTDELGLWLSLLLGQIFVLLGVWLKLLRLGWALAYVRAAQENQPV